jgi:predicted nucleic acid-binding protein
LSLPNWAISPTVVHEVYQTLVYKRRMSTGDAGAKVGALVRDRRTTFLNMTRSISLYSLDLASKFGMGGRDSVIVGCYLRKGIETILTNDGELLNLKKVEFKGRKAAFVNPLASSRR